MNMHPPASALVATGTRPEISTWEELIAAFDAEPGLDGLARIARDRQANGEDLADFAATTVAAFETARVNDGLTAVFELSDVDHWDMGQADIELALVELRSGASAETAYASSKATAGAAWAALHAAVQLVRTKDGEARRLSNEAWKAYWADPACEAPAILRKITTEEQLNAADMSMDEKVELLPVLRAWLSDCAAAKIRHQLSELDAEADAADDRRSETEELLLAASPPHLAAVCAQLSLALERMTGLNPDTPDGIARLTGDLDREGYFELAGVYVNAVRLAGVESAAADVLPFDPASWVKEFEAQPGHRLTLRGPEYVDPVAWGPGMPAYDDIKIVEPEAIARFDARMGDKRKEAGRPITVDHEQRLEYAYPDGGPEHDRLMALYQRRRARSLNQVSPTGADLWRDLEDWQKDFLRTYAHSKPTLFPEFREWTAAKWIEAFEAAGGFITVSDGGEVLIGSPAPRPPLVARLMDVCGGALRYQVDDLAQHTAGFARQSAAA